MDNNYFLPIIVGLGMLVGFARYHRNYSQVVLTSAARVYCVIAREDYEVAETQWVKVGFSVSLRERGQS